VFDSQQQNLTVGELAESCDRKHFGCLATCDARRSQRFWPSSVDEFTPVNWTSNAARGSEHSTIYYTISLTLADRANALLSRTVKTRQQLLSLGRKSPFARLKRMEIYSPTPPDSW